MNSSYAQMLTLLNVIYFLCWEGEGGGRGNVTHLLKSVKEMEKSTVG